MNNYCSVCNMTFKTEKYLKEHVKSKRHLLWCVKKGKTYACKCGKEFSHRQSLHTHKKSCKNMHIQIDKDQILRETKAYYETQIKETIEKYEEKIHNLKEEVSTLNKKIDEMKKIKTQVNPRQKINKNIRNHVISNQNEKCNKCSKQLTQYNVNIDHKIGIRFGGTNCVENLQALCVECHSEKTIKETRNRNRILSIIEIILSE